MTNGGFALTGLSVLGLTLFSLLLFLNNNLCVAWFFLELASISLIPLFFCVDDSVDLVSLFYYMVVSGVSSCLLLSGILFSNCVFFMLLGFLVKFGIFPFVGWVYKVITGSNWWVIWGLSTILKSSFVLIFFFFALNSSWCGLVVFLCSFSCLYLSIMFWVFTFDWKVCWCHMMLSSSAVLVCLSFSLAPVDSVLYIFFLFLFWASALLLFFCYDVSYEFSSNNTFYFIFFYCFLLLAMPFSLSVFYKMSIGLAIFSCGSVFFLCWVVYSISEQFYLLSFLIGVFSEKPGLGVFSEV